jgi:hypothetical protein
VRPLRSPVLLAGLAATLAAFTACGTKEVFCHGPGCTAVCGATGCPPEAGVIYRSVGPGNAAALATGDGNSVRISGGVAHFQTALPDRIGVGDALVLTGEAPAIAFVSRRWSATEYGIQTAQGDVPTDVATPTTAWAIYRAYTSLADAEVRTPNPGIPAALAGFDGAEELKDLAAMEKIWGIACYADAPDTADGADIRFYARWNTDRDHYLWIFTPATPAEAGARQRHAGRYDPSRYELRKSVDRDTGGMLSFHAGFVRVEGLQVVDRAASSQDVLVHVDAVAGGEGRFSDNLLLADPTNGRYTMGIEVYGAPAFTLLAWNNVFAGFTYVGYYDNTPEGTEVVARLANNTFYGCMVGIYGLHGRTIAVNDLFGGVQSGGRCVYAPLGLDAASDHNVCSVDEAMDGAHSVAGASPAWVDAGAEDFHLAAADTAAVGRGADLSQDAVLPFAVDFEGQPRTGAWDVGADQR